MTAFKDYGRPRFTPRERIDASDPAIRTAQHSTVDIVLADGGIYNLDGFIRGTWLLTWDDGASYAEFKTYLDGSGDPAVKIWTVDATGEGERATAAENVSAANTPVADTVHFTVVDGSLVVVNGTGSGGEERVFELTRLT